MVRTAGLEPARGYPRQILSLLCLPIPPRPQVASDNDAKEFRIRFLP